MIPFSQNRFLYNWHWFWDTGNGDIGNQGVHEMDIARWGLGVGLPKSVTASGGKYVYDDDQQTPNTLVARLDYGDKEIVFEVRGLPTGGEADLEGRPRRQLRRQPFLWFRRLDVGRFGWLSHLQRRSGETGDHREVRRAGRNRHSSAHGELPGRRTQPQTRRPARRR